MKLFQRAISSSCDAVHTSDVHAVLFAGTPTMCAYAASSPRSRDSEKLPPTPRSPTVNTTVVTHL